MHSLFVIKSKDILQHCLYLGKNDKNYNAHYLKINSRTTAFQIMEFEMPKGRKELSLSVSSNYKSTIMVGKTIPDSRFVPFYLPIPSFV